ncbi:unknown [Klebsiella variicola CAG:634]|nr:unknown [Klebsiella variicola CAG:634]
MGDKQLDGRRAAQRLKAIEAGLLTVNTVHQLLAQAVAELAAGKAQSAQRALLTHQLFTLHKAVQRDHAAGHRRIVNAVIELRDDVQQMADDTAELLRRGFRGNLPAGDLLAQRRKLQQIANRPGNAPAQRAAGDRTCPFETGIEQR